SLPLSVVEVQAVEGHPGPIIGRLNLGQVREVGLVLYFDEIHARIAEVLQVLFDSGLPRVKLGREVKEKGRWNKQRRTISRYKAQQIFAFVHVHLSICERPALVGGARCSSAQL